MPERFGSEKTGDKVIMDTTLQIGFDTRNVVEILASQYPTLRRVINELIQNQVDEKATRSVTVMDRKERKLETMDNGGGASLEVIKKKFLQIGKSTKSKGAYGQFGVGLLSPIGKCRRLILTSRGKGDKEFYEVVIDERQLEKTLGDPQILVRPSKEDPNKVWWTTKVTLEGINDDSYACRFPTPQEIEDDVISNFNVALEQLRTLVVIVVRNEHGVSEPAHTFTARPYGGTPLTEVEFVDDKRRGTKALFRIFVVEARRGGRGINVGNRENPSRMRWSDFIKHIGPGMLPSELVKALNKEMGLFEGEILTSALNFMNVDRQSFKLTDQTLEFCIAIEEWWKKVGKSVFEEALEKGKDEVYQRSMVDVLRDVDKGLSAVEGAKQQLHQELSGMMQTGTVGVDHARIPRKDHVGEQADRSIATSGGALKPKEGTYNHHQASDKAKGKQGDVNSSAIGPQGRPRRMVRNEGVGLQMEVATMAGSGRACEFMPELGLIRINSRHPDFARCEARGDRVLRQYMVFLVWGVISRILNRTLTNEATIQTQEVERKLQVEAVIGSPIFNQGALLAQSREEKDKKEKKEKKR